MAPSRRRFLGDSLFAAAAAAVGTDRAVARTPRPDLGRRIAANDKIRVAVVGVRGRGRAHVGGFRNNPYTEVAVLCDADSGVVGPAQKAVPDAEYVQDMREVFARDDIDAVSIATPNHWHSLATVWALQSGKHVYCEKPMTHTLSEGREVLAAAKDSGLVVQHGTQARSHRATIEAMEWLRAGGLGKVRIARGLCYKRRNSIGNVEGPQEPPRTCDYDLWTGPAEMQPLQRKNLHYDWHWLWNTGNGDIGNQGVHQMDIARWGSGIDRLPSEFFSVGGRVGYVDDANTPNTLVSAYGFGDDAPWLVFEVRGLRTPPYRAVESKAEREEGGGRPPKADAAIGVIFHCDEGYLVSSTYHKLAAFDLEGNVVKVFEGGGDHIGNFVDAVRAGDPSAVTAPPLEGHLSSGTAHLGNVSFLLGEDASIETAQKGWDGCEPIVEACGRMREHLEANELDASSLEVVQGARMRFDPEREVVVGDHAAAARPLLVREGRGSYRFDANARRGENVK